MNVGVFQAESAESGSDEEDEELEVKEADTECAVCGGDEGLITCSSCPSSFHLDCHQPPLRREPRFVYILKIPSEIPVTEMMIKCINTSEICVLYTGLENCWKLTLCFYILV